MRNWLSIGYHREFAQEAGFQKTALNWTFLVRSAGFEPTTF